MKKTVLAVLAFAAAFAAEARLVARWDFNNFDPANPTSTNVLAATVGEAAYPCIGRGSSTLITDGTLGSMYICHADASDANSVTAFNALGGDNYAIAIPAERHLALPIPDSVKNSGGWTIKIRCWIPALGWHAFFNRTANSDADLFITNPNRSGRHNSGIGGNVFGNNNNYKTGIGIASWQTVTVSGGPARHDVFLNETTQALYGNNGNNYRFFTNEALTVHNGKECLLFCADDDGEDGLIYIDYVEIFDDAAAYEGRAPQYTKDGLTGEWTFSGDEGLNLKATVGGDATRWTRTGSADFTIGSDGILPGDGYIRAGRNNGIKVPHGLPSNASYTIVMDARVPDNSVKNQTWHGLVNCAAGDASLFLRVDGGQVNIRTCGDSTFFSGLVFGEFGRIVATYTHGGSAKVYVNGVLKRTVPSNKCNSYVTGKGGVFTLMGDDDGEDYDTDMSYCAIYDRVLSDAEIKELHSRPLAQKDDGTFMVAAVPAGVWTKDANTGKLVPVVGEPLTATEDGGYTWTRYSAPDAATWVADVTLPAEQVNGGTLVKNESNVASGVYSTNSGALSGSMTTTTNPAEFLTSNYVATWGYWTESALDRGTPHRIAITWTASGLVHYYVDGRLWGQITCWTANTAAKPTKVMSFFNGLDAEVTRLAAYDVPLTPDEVAALGGPDTEPAGTAPVVAVVSSSIPEEVKPMMDTVSFTISATQADGEHVAYTIDWGDGETTTTTKFVASGTQQTFSHVYKAPGTYTPTFKAISQSGLVGALAGTPVTAVFKQFAARDVLLTWPWQQNVYTNRFTIMCEGVKNSADPDFWKGLEVQWGENYANRATMTRVETAAGTWIYRAHITVDDMEGQTIPYRLGYFGSPLTYEDAADNTEGTVKLWDSADTGAFKVGIWGDNQQGARDRDWNSDKYAYVRAIFNHMVAQGVDFGVTSGDMASSAAYDSQIKPGILQATDGILGKTRPYYVAWGNHDTSYPENMKYFETGSVDEEGYAAECAPYHLYRGNVLFIFIPQNCYNATTATWLADLLATDRARAASFRIMVQHYPFWLECWSGNTNTALLATAKAGGVDIIFSGHMHGYERYLKDGIVQLTNGGAGYLDHVESITTYYGDDIFLGGHKNVPYLWARQASPDINNVLGAAEPVRMGCIQSYGELRFEGNQLHYLAHGFNADGSYIGVFDDFTLVSKTCAAEAAHSDNIASCSDPSTFAEFTTKPVTNAKWAEYKTAVGEEFAYPEGNGGKPVVNVSKTEIEKFLVWLNGENGDYRLPTVEELKTAFGGELRREVSEWTRDVDPNTGWCRILGSPAKACEGTWTREEDTPSIATAGCHADYLGFRLATGAAPAEPVCALDAPLAALAAIAAPGRAYKWENNALVDISEEFYNPSGALVYDVPVILTDEGEVTRESTQPLTFNAGFTAPNATSFYATGPLYVKGEVKAGRTTNQWQWRFGSISNEFTIESIKYRGVGVTFRAGDLKLRIKGDNDFSGAMYVFNQDTQHPTNVVTAVEGEPAAIRFQSVRNLGTNPYRVGENVTMKLSGEYRVVNSTALWIDGVLDTEAFNIQENVDPSISGAGTLKLGYYGSYQNSWPYFGVSNIVVTTKRFWRANYPSTKSYNGIFFNGPEVHISSTCDWQIPPKDQFGYNTYVLSNNREFRPKLVFEGEHDVNFQPTYTSGNLSNTDFTNPWHLEMAGTGTFTLRTPIKGDVTVTDGVVKIAKYPTSGKTTVASGNGKWQLDGTVALAKGQTLVGTILSGEGLALSLGATPAPGLYEFVRNGGAAADGLAATHDVDTNSTHAELIQRDGNIAVLVGEFSKTAVWTGHGNRSDPSDPANWEVANNGVVVPGAVPDAGTTIQVFGATSLNVPAGTSIEYGALVVSDLVTLTADCDWRGIGNVVLRDAFTVDLAGHKLTLSSFTGTTAGASAFTDSTTDAEHPGELHLDIPEGTTFTNDKVALTGNLKLVKEGAGTFIPTMQYQTYRGGTLIAAGTATLPVSGSEGTTYAAKFYQWGGYGVDGALNRVITVAEGATLDTKGNYDFSVYHLVLDGGTLANTGCHQSKSDWGVCGNLTLTADSHGAFAYNTRFGQNANTVLDLGGHTFDVVLTGDSTFYLQGVVVKNGTMKVTGAGWFDEYATAANGSDATFDIAVPSWIGHSISCGTLIDRWQADTSALYRGGSGTFVVYDRYQPVGAAFYRVQLADGVTLDLSTKTESWNLVSDNSSYAASFADNAKITIALGSRSVGRWTKVVAWDAAPANLSTLVFQGERKTQKVEVRADGVWMLETAMMIIIR